MQIQGHLLSMVYGIKCYAELDSEEHALQESQLKVVTHV